MQIPASDGTPLIRTDFSSDEAWQRVIVAASTASPDGFRANLQMIDDHRFAGADPATLAKAVDEKNDHVLLVIADTSTMTGPEMSLLCIDPIPPGGQFRVVPEQLWGVENNVSLANMDFSEFANAVDTDGVFRGFRD